jgi:hypothetical protein
VLHTEVIARGCPLTVVHAAMQTLSVEARWLVVQPPRHECSRVWSTCMVSGATSLCCVCMCVCVSMSDRAITDRAVSRCVAAMCCRVLCPALCVRAHRARCRRLAVDCMAVHRSRCLVCVAQGCGAWLRSRVADGIVCVCIGKHLKAVHMALYVALLSRRARWSRVWRGGAALQCAVAWCAVCSSSRAVDAALLPLLLLLWLWLCEVSGELLCVLLCCVGCVGRDAASDCSGPVGSLEWCRRGRYAGHVWRGRGGDVDCA